MDANAFVSDAFEETRSSVSDVPYASTKMDVAMAMGNWPCMPKSSASLPAPGAIMDEEMGDKKVNADVASVTAHFRLSGQLCFCVTKTNLRIKNKEKQHTFWDSFGHRDHPSQPSWGQSPSPSHRLVGWSSL